MVHTNTETANRPTNNPDQRCYQIEGKTLGFPSRFGDASSAVGLFMVPIKAARALISDRGFELLEVAPGRALFSLSFVHYRESDCGVYRECSMAFFVKKQGTELKRGFSIPYLSNWLDVMRDQAATHIWKLPVTTKLAHDAGIQMWGLPKTIDKIDFDVSDGRATFKLRVDDQEVLSYSVAAKGKGHQAPSASAVYSNFEGAPHVTYLSHEYWDMGMRLGNGQLRLGGHPIATQLRSLGLPRRPLVSCWIGKLSLDVSAPKKL